MYVCVGLAILNYSSSSSSSAADHVETPRPRRRPSLDEEPPHKLVAGLLPLLLLLILQLFLRLPRILGPTQNPRKDWIAIYSNMDRDSVHLWIVNRSILDRESIHFGQ